MLQMTPRSALVALLLAGSATSVMACSKADEGASNTGTRSAAWTCAEEAVPMGEVVRCTSSAMTSDAPPAYECNPAESLLCPPEDAAPTGEDAGESPPVGTEGADSSGTTDDASGSTDGTGVGTECGYVPDLDYCPEGGGSTDAPPASSDGTTTDGGSTSCGKPHCPPGHDKKDDGGATTGDGGGTGPGAGAGDGGGGGKGKGKKHDKWKCERGSEGTTCTSEPTCAPGTHPAPCGACVPDGEGSGSDCVPPAAGGCWVTGGGFIEAASLVPAAAADGHDNFGGNAKPMKDGSVKGQWNHVDHGTGNHGHGRVEYLQCRRSGDIGPGQPGGKKGLTANQVYFGGPARWRTAGTWEEGYWFDVVVKDHGEPGSSAATKKGGTPDTYHFTMRKMNDPAAGASGTVVYETKGDLAGGNIQIHAPNAGHPGVSSPLPAWVSLEP